MASKVTGKKILNVVFAAMVVFTLAMTVASIINYFHKKNDLVIPDNLELVQNDTLEGNISDDAKIAVISTDYGDLTAVLYPQFAPETVANFIKLAESGFYDGSFIYEVQNKVCLGGGCQYNDGSLPDGYERKTGMIGPEITKNLWPVKGAVMSCGLTHSTLWRGQETFSGSRFLVSGSIDFDDEVKKVFEGIKGADGVSEMFLKYGGTPNVSQQITIFAQIFEGFDVLDDLLAAKVDEENNSPVNDIGISSVKVMTYAEYKVMKENKAS